MSTTLPDAPAVRPAPGPRPHSLPWRLLRPLASLQLTVALMAFSVGLVFFGTLAQKDAGIWTVVDRYFWSWVVLVDVNHLLDFVKLFFGDALDGLFGLWGSKFTDLRAQSWAKFPWPGGKLLGGLMFVNLLVAQFTRLKFTWKKSGVYLLHAGLLLLFAGEFITREFQVEQQMVIEEGQSADFAVDSRSHELAVTTNQDAASDRVTVVPARLLRQAIDRGETVSHPDLPFDLRPTAYYPNSVLQPPGSTPNPATAAAGLTQVAVERPVVSGVDPGNKQDFPSAYVTLLKKGTDEPLGTYLVSMHLHAQPVPVDGKTSRLELRFTHHYKPYRLHLIDFRFDRYPGTQTPKNFSSQVRLSDPERSTEFETTIAMNEPLRHRGETFYQQSYDDKTEKSTVLQVVRNPGWVLPYLACGVVTLGLAVHFVIALVAYLRKVAPPGPVRERAVLPPVLLWLGAALGLGYLSPLAGGVLLGAGLIWLARTARGRLAAVRRDPSREVLPAMVLLLVGLLFVGMAWPKPVTSGKLDLSEVAGLAVQDGGRFKPLDSVARVDLRLITHRETFTDDKGATRPAIKWLMDSAAAVKGPGVVARYPVFRIENDQVLSLLELKRRDGLRYSIEEIRPRWEELLAAVQKAANKRKAAEAGGRPLDLFENHLLELEKHLVKQIAVIDGKAPAVLPPKEPGGDWRSFQPHFEEWLTATQAKAVAQLQQEGMPKDIAKMSPAQQQRIIAVFEQVRAEAAAAEPALAGWQAVLDAYRANDPAKFTAAVTSFRELGDAALAAHPERGWMDRTFGLDHRARVRLEQFLNRSALFYFCDYTYLLAAVLGLLGWLALLVAPRAAAGLRRTAFWVAFGTVLVHGFTLLARMYLLDRPLVFVTNLYSTAVFIGFGAVVIGLFVERVLPLGLGTVVGSVVGGATCILAHNLAASGDTLDVMQAVLDTNFWLATHVTTINLGYAASYLAGAVGLVYLVMNALPHAAVLGKPVVVGTGDAARTLPLGKVVGQVLYGVVCLALLLSFVGTVLGGIWGDQSWGRFWGWDPKENGALLIVLWNALILHARWCGLVKDFGTAVLALAGNMIVTWSYFGTNQLGVGLHAYGFNKGLVNLCMYLWLSHAVLIGLSLLPWQAMYRPAARR